MLPYTALPTLTPCVSIKHASWSRRLRALQMSSSASARQATWVLTAQPCTRSALRAWCATMAASAQLVTHPTLRLAHAQVSQLALLSLCTKSLAAEAPHACCLAARSRQALSPGHATSPCLLMPACCTDSCPQAMGWTSPKPVFATTPALQPSGLAPPARCLWRPAPTRQPTLCPA